MRDLFLFSAIISLLPLIFVRPQIGILAWTWFSIMNPHREVFGWMYSFPSLDIIAGATLLSCLFNNDQMRKVKFNPLLGLLLTFYLWTCLTTAFAVDFQLSLTDYMEFTKTMLLVLLVLLFMNNKFWTYSFALIFVIGIGATGVKGGIFTALTGGSYRVWGPLDSGWEDNNNVSLAMLMVIPVMLSLRSWFTNKWIRLGSLGAAGLCFLTLLGTQSRGGFVGLVGMSGFYFWRSKNKILTASVLVIFLGVGFIFMPQSWHDRMRTIQNYEEDGSASTRLIQWDYAIKIANERPLIGNGFDAFYHQPYYMKYLYGIDLNRAVHSVYFQVLGEHGYIGIILFLLIGFTAVGVANKNAKRSRGDPDLKWEHSLIYALQFSIVGFAFNGLTINVAYLDLYYFLLCLTALVSSQINTAITEKEVIAAPSEEENKAGRVPDFIR